MEDCAHYNGHKNVSNDMLELLDYIRTNNDAMDYQGELAKLAVQGVLSARNDSKLESDYMKYMTLTWGEQRDLINEGRALYDSCIRLVRAGDSDEQIADKLGYEVSEIQKSIDMARALFPSPSQV